MVKEIAFTAYPAQDVAALRRFYTEALGLQFGDPYSESGEELYAESFVGNGWFAVMTAKWAGSSPGTGIAFEVDDIERAFARLREKGVRTGEIHDTSVCKMGAFTDPAGNTVTLHQITVPH